jgi:hypothetical protein
VQELDTVPSNFAAALQGQSQSAAVFDPLALSMALHPKSDGPQRLTAKFPAQLYGQFEVSARISVHPSSYTSVDVSECCQSLRSVKRSDGRTYKSTVQQQQQQRKQRRRRPR